MGTRKEPADKSIEYVGFRITLGEKAVVKALAKRRHATTGDDSLSGWFRVVLRKEAKAAGMTVDEPIEPKAKPRPQAKRAKRAARTGQS